MTKKIDKRTKAYKDSIKNKELKLDLTPDDLILSRLTMRINESIPTYLLKEIMQLVDCNCVLEAYDAFINTPFRVTVQMQDAINKTYQEFFNEKLRRTSCPSCMKRRLTRIKNHIIKLVKDETTTL